MHTTLADRQPTWAVGCQGNRSSRSGRTQAATARGLAAVVVLALVGGLVDRAGAQAQPGDGPPRKFDDATAAAWKKAGALVGWMGVDSFYPSLEFRTQPDGLLAPVPAFRFTAWQENIVARLPDPGTSFGLHLHGTKVKDAGLKELARLKSLQSLSLYNTKITNAGLKELAGLTSLQSLNLGGTKVTDAGLKELAGLTTLETLSLFGTQVTDAGVAALQRALPTCRITGQ
jgi:internalin A